MNSVGSRAEELRAGLGQFTGTECYYKWWGGLKLTDGVKWLCDKGECYWLVDVIASYQNSKKLSGEGFQMWTLINKNNGRDAVVIAEDGNGKVLVKQVIPYTDFCLDEVGVYCIDGVVLLPTEY